MSYRWRTDRDDSRRARCSMMDIKSRLFDPSINKPMMSLALAESTLSLLERTGVDLEAGEDLTEKSL